MATTEKTPGKKNGFQDFDSFQELDTLAQLYFFSILDCLVDLFNVVAHDFISKPELYSGLESTSAEILGNIYTQYGTAPQFLNPKQRNHIFNASFGRPGSHGVNSSDSFQPLRDSLLETCAGYAANIRLGDNKGILTGEVETARIAFLSYLSGLPGASIQWSRDRLTEVTTAAYQILRNDTVATVFGVSDPPSPTWPFTADPNGNILVEQTSEKQITRGCFGLLQQVAVRGAETIDNVIKYNGHVTDQLIGNCNSWYSALMKARKTCCAAGLPFICRN